MSLVEKLLSLLVNSEHIARRVFVVFFLSVDDHRLKDEFLFPFCHILAGHFRIVFLKLCKYSGVVFIEILADTIHNFNFEVEVPYLGRGQIFGSDFSLDKFFCFGEISGSHHFLDIGIAKVCFRQRMSTTGYDYGHYNYDK